MSFMLLGILNAQASGGGGAAYDLLETTTLTSDTTAITFSGLGGYSDYKHLQLRFVARNTYTGYTSVRPPYLRLNNDSGNYYWHHELVGNGSSVYSTQQNFTGYMFLGSSIPDNDNSANVFGAGVVDILDFNSTNKNTTVRTLSGAYGNSARYVNLVSGLYSKTSAITQIEFSAGSFTQLLAGSRVSLYGIKG